MIMCSLSSISDLLMLSKVQPMHLSSQQVHRSLQDCALILGIKYFDTKQRKIYILVVATE